jgi:hypothetical protein
VIYNKSLESGPILKSGMISLNQLTVDLFFSLAYGVNPDLHS